MSAHCCVVQAQFALPAEVWILVFSHLTAADKSSVRAACKHFKKLIDCARLWRNWTVVLDFPNDAYSAKFWATLRRRGVRSAVLRSSKPKEWKIAAESLPELSTLVVERCSQESLECLWSFNRLKRLVVRSGNSSLVFVSFMLLSHLRHVTHLSLCDVRVPLKSFDVSHFAGLTSLVCHQGISATHSVRVFYSILTGLPKLKHLSWSMTGLFPPGGRQRPRPGPQGGSVLSSLELVDYVHPLLSDHVMKLVPGLQCLSVFHRRPQLHTRAMPHIQCPLKTWLEDLQHLSSLVIVGGPTVRQYADSIPASVTHLTLSHINTISSREMETIATQVPNLLHFHVSTSISCFGAGYDKIPQLFPKLEGLTLHSGVILDMQAWILYCQQLKHLKHLKHLRLLGGCSMLKSHLQDLINNRVQVSFSPHTDLLDCPCVQLGN